MMFSSSELVEHSYNEFQVIIILMYLEEAIYKLNCCNHCFVKVSKFISNVTLTSDN